MNKNRPLIALMLVVTVILLLFSYLDWASLHDIRKDYVSWHIVDVLGIRVSEAAPDWTNTRGEWTIVQMALTGRILFFILNAIVLGYLLKKDPAPSA